jgi:hypothetical protein
MTVDIQPARAEMLVRFGAVAAMLGGVLRIASSFIPYQAEQPWLEGLYGLIDLCLLFGLMAVYLAFAERLGAAGFVLFAAAAAGLASIVGPDARMFGVDFYRAGAIVFMVSLGSLAIQLLRKKTLAISAVLWLAALACSLASPIFATPLAFMGAGILLGAGYVLAGLAILRLRAA